MPQRETGLMPVCACVHLRALARVRACVLEGVCERRAGRSAFTTPGFGSSSAQLAPNERKRRVRALGPVEHRASRPRRRTTAPHRSARGYPAAASGALRCDGALGEGIHTVGADYYTTALHRAGLPAPPRWAPLGSPTHARTHRTLMQPVLLSNGCTVRRAVHSLACRRAACSAPHEAPRARPWGMAARGNKAHASLPGKPRETSRNVAKRRKTSENVGKRREASEAERAALRCLVGHRLLRELGAHAVLVLHERIARLVKRLRQPGRPARVANAGGWKRGY